MSETPAGYTTTASGLFIPTTLQADALSDLRNPTAWLTDWASGGQVAAGVAVSPRSSMGLSAYYACIRAIAEDCAKLPLQVLERLERGRRQAREHELWKILHDQFNDEMASFTVREVMTHWALGWGNGYGMILRDRSLTLRDGAVDGIYPIHPQRVTVSRDSQTQRLLYTIAMGERIRESVVAPMVIPQEDMIHLRGPSPDGVLGYSIAQVAAESLGLSIAAQRYGAGFFGNSGRPGGILSHPGTLSDPARQHLRESWEATHGGSANAGKTAVLEEGMTWTPISIPPEQAQFLDTRNFQVREVCRWFRMPPHKIADLADAKWANVESENTSYVVDTLTPWLTRWEQELQMKLLLMDDAYYVRHNVNSLLRGDVATRTTYYRSMVNIGAMSPNDVRELEELNPYDGGDEYFLQTNMATVKSIVDGTAQQRQRMPLRQSNDDQDTAVHISRNGHYQEHD